MGSRWVILAMTSFGVGVACSFLLHASASSSAPATHTVSVNQQANVAADTLSQSKAKAKRIDRMRPDEPNRAIVGQRTQEGSVGTERPVPIPPDKAEVARELVLSGADLRGVSPALSYLSATFASHDALPDDMDGVLAEANRLFMEQLHTALMWRAAEGDPPWDDATFQVFGSPNGTFRQVRGRDFVHVASPAATLRWLEATNEAPLAQEHTQDVTRYIENVIVRRKRIEADLWGRLMDLAEQESDNRFLDESVELYLIRSDGVSLIRSDDCTAQITNDLLALDSMYAEAVQLVGELLDEDN